jgi:transcriptional regulator with XRE-family HTH domain
MPKTLRSEAQQVLLERLRAARAKAGLTQQVLADRLGRPQSFVAKYERGERRLDVIEFLEVAEALSADPKVMIRAVSKAL